jgi:hypothetical protein
VFEDLYGNLWDLVEFRGEMLGDTRAMSQRFDEAVSELYPPADDDA